MKHDFKPGDLVRLKSGGPLMTYEGEHDWAGLLCVWFEGAKRQREGFEPQTLMRADPSK